MDIFKRKKNFLDIEPKDVFKIIEKHRGDYNYVPLDVRTQEEFENGHIENATFLNFNPEILKKNWIN